MRDPISDPKGRFEDFELFILHYGLDIGGGEELTVGPAWVRLEPELKVVLVAGDAVIHCDQVLAVRIDLKHGFLIGRLRLAIAEGVIPELPTHAPNRVGVIILKFEISCQGLHLRVHRAVHEGFLVQDRFEPPVAH